MVEKTRLNPRSLYIIGGISTLVQLAAILALIVVQVTPGSKPAKGCWECSAGRA